MKFEVTRSFEICNDVVEELKDLLDSGQTQEAEGRIWDIHPSLDVDQVREIRKQIENQMERDLNIEIQKTKRDLESDDEWPGFEGYKVIK